MASTSGDISTLTRYAHITTFCYRLDQAICRRFVHARVKDTAIGTWHLYQSVESGGNGASCEPTYQPHGSSSTRRVLPRTERSMQIIRASPVTETGFDASGRAAGSGWKTFASLCIQHIPPGTKYSTWANHTQFVTWGKLSDLLQSKY